MNSYDFTYSHRYDPPAPVIDIIVRTGEGESVTVAAFLDSGADGTVIPANIIRQIGARYADQRQLVGTTGIGQIVRLYHIQIQIGSDIIYGIKAAAYGNEVILGRDVLNQLTLILDGPLHNGEIRI